ncbi:hypothetical protein FHR92_005049 [Fontibacillus solani]|uniref:Uncharacterized protein n=1 Tax=Fontibacillus solani TaxID=1572857 RepID=A0A7W3XU71_9BACL|nr:hypothetical protein [Fontibacillus solani]MBA9088532.1 hypothetical protein [Fontibacillus solani]
MNNIKELLISISDHNYQIPEEFNLRLIIAKMIQQIGTVDSELRELIYAALARWMIDHNLDGDLVKQITNLILDDNHLFFRIGNSPCCRCFRINRCIFILF